MLTVKYISPTGAEGIYPATQVHYWPNNSVTLSDREFSEGGMVYVMNDAGSTVAKYDLGGWTDAPRKSGPPVPPVSE